MKTCKKMMSALLALMGLCVGTIACSNEEPGSSMPAAKEVAGTYTNDLEVTVMGQTTVHKNVTFRLVEKTGSTVDVVMPAVGEGMMALPSLTIENVAVTNQEGTCRIGVKDYTGMVQVGADSKKYTISLDGTYHEGRLNLNYQLQYGKMPMPIIGKYSSLKK